MNGRFEAKIQADVMAAGHLYVILSESVDWHEFPEFAERMSGYLNASIIHRVNTVIDCIWDIKYRESVISIVFQDYPIWVSLESYDDSGDEAIRNALPELEKISGKFVEEALPPLKDESIRGVCPLTFDKMRTFNSQDG